MNFIAILLMLTAQMLSGNYRYPPNTTSTPTPPAGQRWAAYDPGDLCGTSGPGTTCTNGAVLYSHNNFGNGNVAVANCPTTPYQATFVTAAINGLPASNLVPGGYACGWYNLTTPISSTGQLVLYAVVNISSSAYGSDILGDTTLTSGAFEWMIDGSGHQSINLTYIGGQSGTTVFTTSTWVAPVATFDNSTGAVTFGYCSAGTLVSDGTGSFAAASATGSIKAIGGGDGGIMPGDTAELYVDSGTLSTAGICPFIYAQYGI